MQRPSLFPTLGVAFWITVLAMVSYVVVVVTFKALGGDAALPLAEALGFVVGFGGIGTLAARQVPPPQAERLGLRGMPPRFVLPLLLLVPLALLASEVDHLVELLPQAPRPEIAELAETLKSAGALELLEGVIVAIGIRPVVSEWFFRGVVQQGMVSQLGVGRGIAITALLSALALGEVVVGTSFVPWLAATVSEFVSAIACGLARHYAGSLLAPILLHVALKAAGSLALGFAAHVPIPGFNSAGAHTPVGFLLPAAASVALGIALLLRFAKGPRPAPRGEATPRKGGSAPPP